MAGGFEDLAQGAVDDAVGHHAVVEREVEQWSLGDEPVAALDEAEAGELAEHEVAHLGAPSQARAEVGDQGGLGERARDGIAMRHRLVATEEIGLAVLATTFSLIAVFLPVAFMSGIVGRFMNQFGLTMAFSIAVSLLVSFTLTPMLSARVLRVDRAGFARLMAAEPDIGEIVMRAYILRRVALIRHQRGGVIVIGAVHHADTLRLQRFLVRNGYPHRLLDVETDPDANRNLAHFGLQRAELPAVVTPEDRVFRNPATAEIADALGLTERIDPAHVFDVAVVGAGPAGLAVAVYAASEGLDTIVVEGLAPGGQAGTSSRIENYLGFPTGISGQALAGRAMVQAQKFKNP